MPLLPPVLIASLIGLDEPAPKTPFDTADAWFRAWWQYAQQMTYWNPLTLPVTEQAARAVFVPIVLPAVVPNPVPGIFYAALEVALIAGWVAGSAIPGSLLPAFTPVPLIPPPVPGVLTTALVATAAIGLASPSKIPVRTAMALAIDPWTRLFLATPIPVPPVQPPPIPIV
jgi:hypothetical protein